MDLMQLRYFLDVAQTEHVTKSAARLHVAQPALSRSVHRLEDELGAKLFERAGRGIRLTPAGQLVRRRVEPLMQGLDGLQDELDALRDGERRTVRISLMSASAVVVDAVGAYCAEHPEAHFKIGQSERGSSWDVLVDTVPLEGLGAASDSGELAIQAVLDERILVAASDEAGLGGDQVSLHDLAGREFIRFGGSKRFSGVCDKLCARHDFVPEVSFESDNPAVVRRMIGLGQGVGFWPERSWGALDDAGVRFLRIREEDFRRRIVIATPALRKTSEETERFLTHLVSYMGAQRRAGW